MPISTDLGNYADAEALRPRKKKKKVPLKIWKD